VYYTYHGATGMANSALEKINFLSRETIWKKN